MKFRLQASATWLVLASFPFQQTSQITALKQSQGIWEDVDILGVSCDSFDEATNIKIGRGTGENVTQLFRIRDWCSDFGVKLKINTVVCKLNWEEDMSSIVFELKPFRWKCFQVLVVENENYSPELLVNSDLRKELPQDLHF